jgi:hypothetical protein
VLVKSEVTSFSENNKVVFAHSTWISLIERV